MDFQKKRLFIGSLMTLTSLFINAQPKEFLLFEAKDSSMKSVSASYDASYRFEKGMITVETQANKEYPGVYIKGLWNLSPYYELVLELANLDSKGAVPVYVRLENPGGYFEKERYDGVLVDNVNVSGNGEIKICTIPIPPRPPFPEIEDSLIGMRYTPYRVSGKVTTLDRDSVSGIYVYLNRPRADWKFAIKRIYARRGTPLKLPVWTMLTPSEFFPFIDIYGQFKYKDWPGKIHSEPDMKTAGLKEREDLVKNPGASDRDRFGGWAAGPKFKATGHFYVKKVDGKWWMVDPDGYLFWSHGVVRVTTSCAVTPLDGRKNFFEKLPADGDDFAQFYKTRDELLYSYYVARGVKETYDFSSANIYRKYGTNWRDQFADIIHKRLRSWGMNTIANGSDKSICLMDKTPYTDRIELKSPDIEGSYNFHGWWKFKDPFHPEFRAGLRRQLEERERELRDPWCFGFFVDNEISWGTQTSLAEWTMISPATQPAKIEFVKRLKKKYNDISLLNKVWGSQYSGWDNLLESTTAPAKGAEGDLKELNLVLIEAYFSNVRDEFKKFAPEKLYLGCRFAGSNEVVLRIAAKYCDVISYNVYRNTLSTFSLPEGIDKPVMIGEFHFGALDRGLFHPSLIETKNQIERGKAYFRYVKSALQHPNIIGTHWHQFSDQATTGRFDGENFQVGLTDVCDTPYYETIEKIREVGYKMYQIRSEVNKKGGEDKNGEEAL